MIFKRTSVLVSVVNQGEYGGPVVHWDAKGVPRLVGVVSYGQCDYGSAPTVATRVLNYLEWIDQTIREEDEAP